MASYIVSGPGKFDLVVALFDGKLVEFTVDLEDRSSREIANVNLQSVTMEDGSRESWNIQGYIVSFGHMTRMEGAWIPFKAYYNGRTRKGTMELL